jgi:hypothetical protein
MSNELYTGAMYDRGLADAADLQERSSTMTGTQLYAEEEKIPDFLAAKAVMNMSQRPVGFVCRSSAGRVVKLLQVYDSNTYPQEPEELAAQWGFVWSKDPRKALPFIQLSTSTYATGECCTAAGHVWRSKQDGVNWSPETNPEFWDDLGTIEEVMSQDWDVDEPEPEQPEEGGESSDDDDPYKDVQDWFEPDSEHYYNKGDRMRYTDGHVYESLIDTNTYSPEAYPQGWKLLA